MPVAFVLLCILFSAFVAEKSAPVAICEGVLFAAVATLATPFVFPLGRFSFDVSQPTVHSAGVVLLSTPRPPSGK